MTTTDIVILAFSISTILIVWRKLGITKGSFKESINDSLDAIYVRDGIFFWELLIAAKGAEVGIIQGRFLLPGARARAAKVGQGKLTIL